MNITMFGDGKESEPGTENYFFEIPIGAAGAVGTLVRQRGLLSVVRQSAGVYLFTLVDGVIALVDWSFDIITATPTAGGAWPRITARTQNSITLTVMNAAGAAATDPNSGDVIIGSLTAKNSNA